MCHRASCFPFLLELRAFRGLAGGHFSVFVLTERVNGTVPFPAPAADEKPVVSVNDGFGVVLQLYDRVTNVLEVHFLENFCR